ncbi:hypothetical protein RAA17_16345 [Komagataeibacter rhaeticus]|nr:hypothetical protein [Komagataeibacter rhaeticus]
MGFTRRIGLWLGAAVVLGGAAAVMLVLQLAVLARIVSDLAFHGHVVSDALAGLAMLLALLVVRVLLQWAADMVAGEGSLRLSTAIRSELLRHLFHVGPVGLAGQATGHMVTVLGTAFPRWNPILRSMCPGPP